MNLCVCYKWKSFENLILIPLKKNNKKKKTLPLFCAPDTPKRLAIFSFSAMSETLQYYKLTRMTRMQLD